MAGVENQRKAHVRLGISEALGVSSRWVRTVAGQTRDSMRVVAGAARRAAVELLFPARCTNCRAEMSAGDSPHSELPFCDTCLDRLQLFRGTVCNVCGAPMPAHCQSGNSQPVIISNGSGCYRCRGRRLWFDTTFAAGVYEGLLREMLLRMKRAEGDSLSLAMGQLIWLELGPRLVAANSHVVVPIPLHWRRRLAHRTNSAAVVAEVLAARLRLPLAEDLLRRQRSTRRQFDLTPPQRWGNVRRAFVVPAGYHLRDAHVLLVDDILTTGATCSEAARALRAAGAERVSVVVAARAFGQ